MSQSVSHQKFVILVGANVHQRASICHAARGEALHIEPVGTFAELRPRDFSSVDVLLVWDEGERIEELREQLSILGCWSPIVAICENPSAFQIVRAIRSGAFDYVDWAGDFNAVRKAVFAAYEAKGRMLPQRQRQIEARNRLQTLTRRERQVLIAMSQGMTNKQIGLLLRVSSWTVEIHQAKMMTKIGANHSADAVRVAIEASLTADWFHRDKWMAPWSLDDLVLPDTDCFSDVSTVSRSRDDHSQMREFCGATVALA
jgi:FixJ family two-component response regulator